jgi:hypothetical protein
MNPNLGRRIEHWISMNGQIEEGDEQRLKAVIATIVAEGNRGIFASTFMTMSSSGGDLDPSIKLVEAIREFGIGTHLGPDAICYSGCALVFMAGRWRDGDDSWDRRRVMNPTAKLGFHAPFAFASADAARNADLDEKIKSAIIGDVERGGVDAARKLLKLTLDEPTMPASLVEELLKYEADAFLTIDNINKAGRWKIALENAVPLSVGSILTQADRRAISGHCTNQTSWLSDRFAPPGLISNYFIGQLLHTGMADFCEYTLQSPSVYSDIRTDGGNFSGVVVEWHSFAPETLLADLADKMSSGPHILPDNFVNPPVSQVEGKCLNGFHWIGGWSGAAWVDATAHATFRDCSTTETVIRLECKHGTGVVETWIGPSAIGQKSLPKTGVVSIQIGDGYLLDYKLKGTRRQNSLALLSRHQRNYFTIRDLKSSNQLMVQWAGRRFRLHLSGSRRAIEAMERSCL